jgi:hypothetical protein
MLLEEITISHPQQFAKKLQNDLKEYAKSKCHISVLSGMGWPAILKDSIWYGGFFNNSKSASDEEMVLPFEVRVKGVLKFMAKQLQALVDEGHSVKVGLGYKRSDAIAIQPGDDIFKVLLSRLREDTPPSGQITKKLPSIVCQVSIPSEIVDKVPVFFYTSSYYGKSSNKMDLSAGAIFTRSEAKMIDKNFKVLHQATPSWKLKKIRGASISRDLTGEQFEKFRTDLLKVLGEINGKSAPAKSPYDTHFVWVKTSGVVARDDVIDTTGKLEAVVRKYLL